MIERPVIAMYGINVLPRKFRKTKNRWHGICGL